MTKRSRQRASRPRGALDWILSPLEADCFLSRFWGRQSLLVRRAAPVLALTMRDLVGLMEARALRFPSVRLVQGGHWIPVSMYTQDRPWGTETFSGVVDSPRALSLFRAGASLVFPALSEQWPPLARLCGRLARELGVRCTANAYMSPPRGTGFVRHADPHDVLVFQLAGRKTWSLAARCWELARGASRLRRRARGQPLQLDAGDVLYLPAGVRHRVAGTSVASLHTAIGLTGFRWSDVLAHAIDDWPPGHHLLRHAPTRPGLRRPAEADRFDAAFRQLMASFARGVRPSRSLRDLHRGPRMAPRLAALPGRR